MWEYTDKVKEHFLKPRNVGEIENPDGVGEVGSLACGDALKLFLKVDENERIVDAKFQTFGCASAIASSSALTELVKGMTLDEAAELSNEDIAEYLGGLPKEKMHCSVMGQEALEAAIKNYRGEAVPEPELDGELICKCFGVTDTKIKKAVEEHGLRTIEEVTHYTKAGGGCEECHDKIQDILDQMLGSAPKVVLEPIKKPGLTNIQRMKKVMQVMEAEIRPSLQRDGGDVDLVDVQGVRVVVSLRGACTNCPSSQLTLKDFIEKKLREQVDEEIVVVQEGA